MDVIKGDTRSLAHGTITLNSKPETTIGVKSRDLFLFAGVYCKSPRKGVVAVIGAYTGCGGSGDSRLQGVGGLVRDDGHPPLIEYHVRLKPPILCTAEGAYAPKKGLILERPATPR